MRFSPAGHDKVPEFGEILEVYTRTNFLGDIAESFGVKSHGSKFTFKVLSVIATATYKEVQVIWQNSAGW